MYKLIKNKNTYNFLRKNNFFGLHRILIFLRRFFFNRKKVNVSKNYSFTILGDKHCQTFSGYYDINPISNDETKILYHKLEKNFNSISVFIFDFKKKESKKVFFTKAWSWQLGARLQWIDNNHFISNIVENNELKSKKIDLNGKIIETHDYPIFSLDKTFTKNLFLNFKILENHRKGYGYDYEIKDFKKKNFIALYDLEKKEVLFKLEMLDILREAKLSGENYYFNHLSWSKNNESFLAYVVKTNPRISKLIYFKDKNNFKIINDIDLISHHAWVDEKRILFYGKIKNIFGFYLYDLQQNKIETKFKNQFSNLDGHPNSQNGENFVIDTYPNKFGERDLYLLDLTNKNNIKHICSLFSDYNFKNDSKCDLHPKFSKDSSKIIIDTSHNNFRQIMILKEKKN